MGLLDLFKRGAAPAPTPTPLRAQAETAKLRGNTFMAARDYPRAAECYAESIRLDPTYPDAHNNLGLVCVEIEDYARAEVMLERALELNPQLVQAHFNLAFLAQQICSWGKRRGHVEQVLELIRADTGPALPPFQLLAFPELRAADILAASRRWASQRFNPPGLQPLVVAAHYEARRPLRIGYLSANYHQHAVPQLMAGVLEAHDRQRFEVYGYSIGPDRQDATRERIVSACGHFRDLRTLDDAAAARQIAADQVDILIDLMGYTQDCRPLIAAHRPAPIVVNWLGYPGTLGDRRLADYLIGDPVVTPPEHAAHFAETLALHPSCYQPNDHSRIIGPATRRADEGLPEEAFVFCSFNQIYKITPDMFELWCHILRACPGSVLWLMESTELAMRNLRREAASRGIADDRLYFARHQPIDRHLARLALADLALDTFPYTSHTTGSDALWAGVPLATRIGETFPGRVAASLLRAVGLSELVADSDAGYVELVCRLAADPAHLATLRSRLREHRQTAALFDTPRFTREYESLLEAIWEHARRGVAGTVSL
jgi:predicted O-linked N-acetylglucosamine transferase (SPINDLY family)